MFLIPGAPYQLQFVMFQWTKVLIGDVNIFSEAIKVQAHLSLKMLYEMMPLVRGECGMAFSSS
jgi:hypothetical protein